MANITYHENPFLLRPVFSPHFSAQNCSEHSGKKAAPPTPDAIMAPVSLPEGFNEYWYAGKAEACTYEVTQERYGEIRQAEQVNIFVTENFTYQTSET